MAYLKIMGLLDLYHTDAEISKLKVTPCRAIILQASVCMISHINFPVSWQHTFLSLLADSMATFGCKFTKFPIFRVEMWEIVSI
jgi:hypothetical protein